MTDAKIIQFAFQDHPIRTQVIDNQPFFVGKDVCEALGIKSHRDALQRLDEDERRESVMPTPSGTQQMVVINESGLYHLIFKSRKQKAREFRKWVTGEVLPALRRTGRYQITERHATGQLSMFPDTEWRVEQMRQAAMDLALSCSPNSKAAKFLRIIKPLLFNL